MVYGLLHSCHDHPPLNTDSVFYKVSVTQQMLCILFNTNNYMFIVIIIII